MVTGVQTCALPICKNEKKVIGMALMCALTMLQVTDVSAAEIAKGKNY